MEINRLEMAKVYKIMSATHPDLIYYGSTTKVYLSSRMAQHCTDYKRYSNAKRAVFQLLQYEDAVIELVEETTTKKEAIEREQWYINNMPCVNKMNAILKGTKQEKLDKWKKENPEKQAEQLKKYYEANKDEIRQHQNEYREENRIKIRAKNNEKIPCSICEELVPRANLSRHKRVHHTKSTQVE